MLLQEKRWIGGYADVLGDVDNDDVVHREVGTLESGLKRNRARIKVW